MCYINVMTLIEKHFEKFAEFLENESESGGEIPDYKTICAKIGASPKALDKYLMSQFGTSGEDIVTSYRTHTPIDFL